MSDIAIRVENLGKQYRIGRRERYDTLRDALVRAARMPLRWLSSRRSDNAETGDGTFWALRDVSFEVSHGEVVGIIGRNGAGKSTLLKILAQITEPTTGAIDLSGRVASLLEVGTGFHPELTGRENIFLNGAILGMKRAEIVRKFDEIVAFAEVEQFIDTPVKHYSSGMYMRLAFAVAAHLEPEILVVDEVLAVGDAEFQNKCLGTMRGLARSGRTVLFVSHNMPAVRNLCRRGLVMHQGSVICEGTVDRCVERYLGLSGEARSQEYRVEPDPGKALAFRTVNARLLGEQPHHVLRLEMELVSQGDHKPAHVAVDILDGSGSAIMQAIPTFDGLLRSDSKVHHVTVEIQLPPLIPREYLVSVWAGSHNTETLDWAQQCVSFEVMHSPARKRVFPYTADHGYIVPASVCEYLPSALGGSPG